MEVPALSCNEDDLVRATFHDGMIVDVEGFTIKKLREFLAARGGKVHAPLWEGTHLGTHHVLQLRQRADRALLLSLYEQSRQICQWRVANHGTVEEPTNAIKPAEHVAVVATAEFAIPWCISYAEGRIKDARELKSAVANEYQRMAAASTTTKTNPKKRPSSNVKNIKEVENMHEDDNPPVKKEKVTSQTEPEQQTMEAATERCVSIMPEIPESMADFWLAELADASSIPWMGR